MHLTATSSDEQLLAAVEEWIEALASDDYERAFRLVHAAPESGWTASLLRSVISGYGVTEPHSSGNTFRVTSLASAAGVSPRRTVERMLVPPGAVAYVEHDLPLNGTWSDLTATFSLQTEGANAELLLEEVHVF